MPYGGGGRTAPSRSLGYVLGVSGAQRLGFGRVEELAGEVPADGWHRLSAGEGAKGPRLYDWAYARHSGDADAGREKGLLIRRKLDQSRTSSPST